MPGAEQQGGTPHGPIMDQELAEAARTAAELPTKPQPGCVAGKAAVASETQVGDGRDIPDTVVLGYD